MAKRNTAVAEKTRTPRSTTPAPSLAAVAGSDASPLALDRVIHERLRLAIISALAVHESMTFSELRTALDASDGNLSVHARKLEDAGYIACKKGFDGRIPRTEYRLTTTGRRALERYVAHMESLIKRVSGE